MDYIRDSLKFGSILGLERIEKLLERMGNPQDRLKYIHVGGTNGKGSTVTFISSILIEAGYRVGIYTSPSIHNFNERIRINDREIADEDIASLITMIKGKVDEMVSDGEENPTEFEITTAMAFQYFHDQDCDFVLLEVGLGGRLDSTNIIKETEVSVITTIDYDHMEILGDTLAKIAAEKAGIIKEDGDVVLYPQAEEADKVIREKVKKQHASLHEADFNRIRMKQKSIAEQTFDYKEYDGLTISLLGDHQVRNAAVALEAIEVLKEKGYVIPEEAIRKGLRDARWPGRFEVLSKKPVFIADGAHNVQGVNALRDNLVKYFGDRKITFILGVLEDKDYQHMVTAVLPLARRFIAVAPNNRRALSPEALGAFISKFTADVTVMEDIDKAIEMSLELSGDDDIICSFGSLYYIGQVREFFNKR